jgi:hypothetical protein
VTPTQRAAMEQMLVALESGREYAYEAAEQFHVEMRGYRQQRHDAMDADVRQLDAAITAGRAALAEPVGEPVGFSHFFSGELIDAVSTGFKSRMEQNNDMSVYDTPLYTAPQPPAPAVELTDDDLFKVWSDYDGDPENISYADFMCVARAAIAAHEQKRK